MKVNLFKKDYSLMTVIGLVALLLALSFGFTWLLVFTLNALMGWPAQVNAGTVALVWLAIWALKVLFGGKRNG